MDHDKQVKDLVQVTRDRFLDQPIQNEEKDRENFDLEGEFAKSAKNKSPLIPLVVLGFLLVLGTGAWIASLFTDKASQQSTVSIGAFDDLKLKEIFDMARKNKKDLDTIQSQMNQLTVDSAAKVATLQQAGQSKADIAAVNDVTGEKSKQILAETARLVAAEKAALSAALKPLKAQAEEVQKKIDSYDDRIGEMNKKNKQVLDSQQRLFDLEKQKLTAQYQAQIQAQTEDADATVARLKKEREDLVLALKNKHAAEIRALILKYNPVANDPILSAQLAATGSKPAVYPTYVFPDRIVSKDLLPQQLQASLAARVEKTHYLLSQLRAIPYENSVPPLLNALDNAIADSLAGYDGFLAPLASAMTDLDTIIAQREATIAAREATIAAREAEIQNLLADLESERYDRKQSEAAMTAAAAKAMADEQSDRAMERARAQAYLARWTGGTDAFVTSLRNEDGVIVDASVVEDLLVVIKEDRGAALLKAIDAAAATPPPAAGKQAPPPVNLAMIRDGLNNNELGTVTVTPVDGGGWRAHLLKLNDPKRPFKSYDRLTLTLPNKR